MLPGPAVADALVGAAWVTLALDGLRRLRRERGVRAALGPPIARGWRPSTAAQGLLVAATLAAAGLLEVLSGRLAFRAGPALVGLLLVGAGLALHLRARRALGALWSGVIEVRPGTLVADGPYARVRHPLYLALLLLTAGSLLVHPSVATACLAGGLGAGLALKMRAEERALASGLGADWARYAARVPALVPALGPSLARLGALVNARRRRYALVLGVALWGGWLVSLAAGPGHLDLAGQVKGADFIEFYAAGTIVASGRADRLYDLELQRQVEHEVTAPQDWPGFHGFLNPPFFALLFVPLAGLPYLAALAVWSLLGVGLVAGTLRLVGRGWAALPWTLAFVPVFAAVSYGQNSLLSLLLLAATYACLRRGRDVVAGVVLGCLLYKPQLVVVLALALLADRRWRTLGGLGATALVLAAVSWAMSPSGAAAWVRLSRAFPTMLATPGFPTWNMHSLYSFLVLLLPEDRTVAQALTLVASVGVLGAARALQPRYGPDTLARWYAVAVWATTLVSPHLFLYDLSLLVLPALLLAPEDADPRWTGGLTVLWVTLVFSGPLTHGLVALTGAGVQLSVPVVAAVGWALLREGVGAPAAASAPSRTVPVAAAG